MGVIKLGFISIIVFALIITGISLFFPSHIRVSKAIDIRAGKDSVMNEISDAVNWKKWFPGGDSASYFVEADTIKGIITSTGQSLVITRITDTSVLAKYTGPDAKKGQSGWNIIPTNSPDFITVQWFMDFQLRWYPWEKFSSLLLEKRYGPMMEQGLDKLKKLLEK